MASRKEARAKLLRWRENPVHFVVDNFKVEPDEWQLDVLRALGGGYNNQRRVVMKACTGPGKSALLAWVGWHRLTCYAERGEHPKGAALSITRDNLKDNLWAELAKWQGKSDFLSTMFEWTKERIYSKHFPSTWFLSARSFAKDADQEAIGRALSGLHSRFPFLLLDESGDMPVAVGRAAEQIFTGSPLDALIAQAGNPTSNTGLLYHSCSKSRDKWIVITITADPDDPKRTPRVDADLAAQQIKDYGRDNPWVMATILGLFPPAGFNQLLSLDEVEAAIERHYKEHQYSFAPRIIGVDVAREGDDSSVVFRRQGLVAYKPHPFRNIRSHDLAGHVIKRYREWQADGIIVDGTGGYGGGVIDALQQMGVTALDCQFAAKAYNKRFANKRTEIWFELAEWIKNGGSIPNVPHLITELTTPTYSYKGDRMILEPKEQIKKRLGRSPDFADALAVTFAKPIQKRDLLGTMIEQMTPKNSGSDWHPFADM